jgi:signal transduction histidine kinase
MMRKSYTAKLITLILSLLFLTTFSFFLLNYQIEKKMLIDQIRQRALLLGKTLQINLTQLILKTRQTGLTSVSEDEKTQIRDFIKQFGEEEIHLDIYSQNEEFHDLFIFDEENRVIIDFPASKEGRILPENETLDKRTRDALKRNEIFTELKEKGQTTYLLITLPLFNEKIPFGFARIEMSMNESFVLLRKIKLISLLVATGLLLIGTVIATLLAKNLTYPINQLAKKALLIGKGDFEPTLDESRQDEIGQLMVAFNRMGDDLRKFEEMRRRVEKLEIASQFSAKMAHEIRNPLNSVGLIIDHLRDAFQPVDPVKQGKIIELTDNIKGELGRLNKIVEEFLRLAGPRPFERQPTLIDVMIEEVVNLVRAEALNQQIEIKVRHDPNLPKIETDNDRLRRALLNLLINSIQAMPEGGKIDLRTGRHRSGQGNEHIFIRINDTGPGIPRENMSRLFEPYFTTKINGFGLGLAIVSRIVQEHEGTIQVESVIGRGTTFTIFLPIVNGVNHV